MAGESSEMREKHKNKELKSIYSLSTMNFLAQRRSEFLERIKSNISSQSQGEIK